MADLHKAIRAIHVSVISISGDTQETIVARDQSGNNVSINWTDVNAWVDPNEYKYKREKEYPTIEDQLDMQYHDNVNGTTTWKDAIAKVKSDNPKE
tara:strand:+ start:471 stop:758 length:288 start_codon:yes stop_codon:yes gene_type:complete